jgi:hypothetical protein
LPDGKIFDISDIGGYMNMEWTLRNKLLTVMMIISLIPLGIIGFITYTDIQNLGILAANQTALVGEQSVQEATEALNKLGEEMIQRIAQDVRMQVDIYLAAHPKRPLPICKKIRPSKRSSSSPLVKPGIRPQWTVPH